MFFAKFLKVFCVLRAYTKYITAFKYTGLISENKIWFENLKTISWEKGNERLGYVNSCESLLSTATVMFSRRCPCHGIVRLIA
jgi:hypothetical protein